MGAVGTKIVVSMATSSILLMYRLQTLMSANIALAGSLKMAIGLLGGPAMIGAGLGIAGGVLAGTMMVRGLRGYQAQLEAMRRPIQAPSGPEVAPYGAFYQTPQFRRESVGGPGWSSLRRSLERRRIDAYLSEIE